MGNRVNFADITKKLIAESFSLGCPAHQSGNIYKT